MTLRKRGEHWHYQFMIDGQLYYGVFPEAESKKDAQIKEAEEKRKVRLGERAKSSDLDRFEKFVDEVYLKYSKENKASWRHDEFRCEMLCKHFGGKRFSEIKPMHVVTFINQRLASKVKRHRQVSEATRQRSPVTVHKEITLLSSIFRMAMREQIITVNPVAEIPKHIRKKLKPRNPRRCPLDDQKEAALIENGLIGRYAHLRPVVLFDLNTGLRLGELRRLERGHVNLEPDSKRFDIDGQSWELPQDCLIVVQSKNGKPRVVPLNRSAVSIARHQLEDATIETYLFPSSKTDGMIKEVKKGFKGACEAAGVRYGQYDVDGTTFHTLRHRFNSKLSALGVNKTVRRDLLGHSPGDMTDYYTHSTLEEKRRAVEMLCHSEPEKVIEFPINCGKIVATA